MIVDGQLVFASEEERWTRRKHSPSEPPINALKQAFKFLESKYGIKPKEVDTYAVNYDPKLIPSNLYSGWLKEILFNTLLKYNYFSGVYGSLSAFNKIRTLAGAGFRYLIWRFDRNTILIWAERLVKKAIYDLSEELPSQDYGCSYG